MRFGRITPTLAVADMPAALRFYQGVLGFQKMFENGDPVTFAILKRDAAEFHLTADPSHQGRVPNVAHLMVDDAAGLHDFLVSQGVHIVKPLREAEYGLLGFVFADPDGNRLDVGQVLEVEGDE